MKILVTGGAGYIGSTICSALEDNGHTPIVLDNFSRGQEVFTKGRITYKADIADTQKVIQVLKEHSDIYCTIHCAAFIIVPESEAKPYDYYKENVAKSLELFNTLINNNQKRIVFSSSASIYDTVPNFMVTEESPLKPQSPYARTKYIMEMILQNMSKAYGLQSVCLRYFNPIGADPKMRSGIHDKHPSHIVGKLAECALGISPEFKITGTDWPTRDGTGIRDYIHVWDLALAHVKAIENFNNIFSHSTTHDNHAVINLGSGNGITVRELVTAFEKVYGKSLNKVEAPSRPGDVAGAYANANLAYDLLGWKTTLSIEQGISDALKWAKVRKNILGYP